LEELEELSSSILPSYSLLPSFLSHFSFFSQLFSSLPFRPFLPFFSLSSYLLLDVSFSVDWLTFVLILWNFSVVGLVSIFWNSSLYIQQGYLVIISALVVGFFFSLRKEWKGSKGSKKSKRSKRKEAWESREVLK
jgi:hypothetical protein